jgi:phosphatidylglycerophosphate synthase
MVRTAIILAFDDEGMEPVFGIPATRRLVSLLVRLGFGDIHLVGRVSCFIPILSDLVPQQSFHPTETEESLERVGQELGSLPGDKVMVLGANHVADRHSLTHFLRSSDDATISHLEVTATNGMGDGLYLVDQRNLMPLIRAKWSHCDVDSSVVGNIEHLQSINGLPCVIKRGGIEAGLAEERLVNALSAQTKADDGFIARHFDRRISQCISKRLAHTNVSPNQITLAGMIIGLIGAFLLSRPGYWPKLIGSLLFVFCVIVDGVDGEVARLKLKESSFGHYLDIVTDNMVHVAVFAGIAFGLYHDTGNVAYIDFLWVLMGGFCLCAVAVYQCILRLDADALNRSPLTLRIMALVTNRDFAYLVFFLAIISRLNWFLIGATIGSYLFAIALWLISSHERRLHSFSKRRESL